MAFSGAGAAGCAIARLMADYGFKKIYMVDSKGIVTADNASNAEKKELAEKYNTDNKTGTLADAMKGADIFIGVSKGGIVTEEMIASMNKDAIVMAMANPTPEILPDLAKKAGARVVGTGRSDFANQINNVLIFPALFRGALDAKATRITEGMKMAASKALADLITEEDLKEDYVIVDALDKRVGPSVAKAVAAQAVKEGVIRG